eukprot:Skav220163  [mRNA]  locus=scaffold564:276008:279649:- [translate_table: standard]
MSADRPLLGPRARDAQLADVMQLDDSSGAFYSSAGSTDVSFDITHDRVLKSDIDRVWPNLNVRFEEGTGSVTSQSLSDYTAELLSDPSPFGGAGFCEDSSRPVIQRPTGLGPVCGVHAEAGLLHFCTDRSRQRGE